MIRPSAPRLPGRVQANAAFADPHKKRPYSTGERHGGVRDANPGLKHHAGDAAHGQQCARAGLVHQHEGAIKDIQAPALDEDERDALFDGDGG